MLDSELLTTLLVSILIMAILYSSVGHGGASGYLAVMALLGLAPETIRPAALTMNIFVSSLVLYRLNRAGYFNWKIFYPLALASIPMAYLGGTFIINDTSYRYLLSVALLIAASRLLIKTEDVSRTVSPKITYSLPIGAGLGFVSGLTGIGGGIFLSPLLLFLRWTSMRTNAAIAAAFILVNSIAGLSGYLSMGHDWPDGISYLVIAALCGALIGSELAVRRFTPEALKKTLGLVLIIAAIKMFATA